MNVSGHLILAWSHFLDGSEEEQRKVQGWELGGRGQP